MATHQLRCKLLLDFSHFQCSGKCSVERWKGHKRGGESRLSSDWDGKRSWQGMSVARRIRPVTMFLWGLTTAVNQAGDSANQAGNAANDAGDAVADVMGW